MVTVEEITSSSSYKFSDLFKIKNLAKITEDEMERTFQEHDDVIRLEEVDDSPLTCAKYFNDYYIFANGLPKLGEKSIMITNAYKIPNKFIESLPSKDFATIIGSFFEEVSEGFIWKDKIKDGKDPKKVVGEVAFASMIFDKKYLDFLQKYA